MDKLYIVIPAYNEEANIESVTKEWHEVVQQINDESMLCIIDDGSKDNTYDKLLSLKDDFPQMEVINKANGGHGATVLYGYKHALINGADYVFQTDSDGQTISSEFASFWERRNKYDFIIGFRKNRKDGFSRILVTKVLRVILFFQFGKWIKDANTPFRLMSASSLKEIIKEIPDNHNLSNVLLSVLYHKRKKRIKYIPITFRPRQGGVNSINFKRIIKIGFKAVKDFAKFNKTKI